MPEYPHYPGTDPDQPQDGSPSGPTPSTPPPLGAWPPPQQQPPGQAGYGQPSYGQSPQQPPGYGYPPPGYAYAYGPPKHPNATTAMVLGIVAIATGFTCGLPLFLAPFAWFMGARAVREIDASGGQQGGRSEAMTGKVLGIVGSALLVLGVLAIFFLTTVAFVDPSFYVD